MNRLERIKQKDLIKECQFLASRSSGPGGQNVNKVNTQITLRFDVKQSDSLDDEEKDIILRKLSSYVSGQGILILNSQSHRSQLQNKEETIIRFNGLLEKAFTFRKVRKASRPTKASVQRRLDNKRKLSEKKKRRQRD